MRELVESGKSRLLGVCDISCDMAGSIQFLSKFTDMDQPFFMYDPLTERITQDGINGEPNQ